MKRAGVMLVIQDGLILGISRRNDKTKFGLPGGKNEPNETSMQAAIRECYEETGVYVYECVEVYHREEPPGPDGIWFYSYAFYATEWKGKPSSSEEGIVKWMTASELTSDQHGAFAEYNRNTFAAFTKIYPDVKLR